MADGMAGRLRFKWPLNRHFGTSMPFRVGGRPFHGLRSFLPAPDWGVALSLKCAGHKGRCFSRRPWLCRFGKYRPNMLARLEPGKSKPIPTCTTANMRIMWCPKAGQDDNLGRRAPSQSHFLGLADNTQIGVELVWGKAPVSVLASVSS